MNIVVGLGNPGVKYQNTYHNIGFMALDIMAEELGVKFKTRECLALTARARVQGQDTVLLKPQTYMNLSGDSVYQALKKYGAQPQDLIVIYDDFDIESGSLRIRSSGSAGTHNGMKSIIAALGTQDFVRIRVGMGKPTNPHIKNADRVLSQIPRAERDIMETALCRAAAAATDICGGSDLQVVMQKYNTVQSAED